MELLSLPGNANDFSESKHSMLWMAKYVPDMTDMGLTQSGTRSSFKKLLYFIKAQVKNSSESLLK